MRVLLGLAAVAFVVGAGGAAGGAFAGTRQGPAQIRVGDALEVNGQPMRLSLFSTSDPAPQVIAFYTARFLERGLLPVTFAGHVSVFDPKDGMQRFVTAISQPNSETLVLIGSTNPRKPPLLVRSAKAAKLAVPDQSRAFLGYSSDDDGVHADSAQFVTSQSPEQVAEFYRRKMQSEGFRERAESATSFLQFDKGGESFSAGIQALDDKGGAAVFVQHLEKR
ncbi:MAG TPA: hypothetical protein VGH20_21505 [Myxococcales bacterium]|jgi:hypothetical protein